MTAAYDAMVALKAHLEGITATNGYPVTVASVGIGQAALAVGSQAPLPALTMTIAQDDLPRTAENAGDGAQMEAGPGTGRQSWERTVWLEGFVSGASDWDQALDALLDAIRRSLASYGPPLRFSGATFAPPEPGGRTATLKMALIFPYCAYYTDHLYL